MAYNPVYNKPSWTSGEVVDSSKLNQMVDNTEHNHKYKPELPDGVSSTVKITSGFKQVTLPSSATGPQLYTIDFATDSAFGDPGFTGSPNVVLTHRQVTGTSVLDVTLVMWSVTGTQVTFYLIPNGSPPADTDYHIHFFAMGV